MYEARFIDGPMDGQKKVFKGDPVNTIRVRNRSAEGREMESERGQSIAEQQVISVYELWDNWPVRYKLKTFE